MRRTLFALTGFVLTALSAPLAAAAEPSPVCQALHGLADQARRSREPQRIAILRGDRALDCQAGTPGAATAAFCAAVFNVEPAVATWLVGECVQTVAADPQVTTGAEPSGYKTRRMITRLAAKLGGGVRLDIAATARRDDLVVWKAD
jgi:hypothetical protein